MIRKEIIGNAELYLGDCLAVMPTLEQVDVDHIICDPPYEAITQAAIGTVPKGNLKGCSTRLGRKLDFEPIDLIREDIVRLATDLCSGWFIVFCTPEGVGRWADCINASSLKYKRACIWVKPDSTPQFNGQCPASGAECFVTAWGGGRPCKMERRRQARRLHAPRKQRRTLRPSPDRKAEAPYV